jgi:hypothetical protein
MEVLADLRLRALFRSIADAIVGAARAEVGAARAEVGAARAEVGAARAEAAAATPEGDTSTPTPTPTTSHQLPAQDAKPEESPATLCTSLASEDSHFASTSSASAV